MLLPNSVGTGGEGTRDHGDVGMRLGAIVPPGGRQAVKAAVAGVDEHLGLIRVLPTGLAAAAAGHR
jgi:hypothetical protein